MSSPAATPRPAAGPTPRARPARVAEVVEATPLTPSMVRVILGGAGLRGFTAGPFTDHYVKLQLPARGADYQAPFDVAELRGRLPREQWPVTRTYTVRHWDPIRGELTVDFVVHGDEGVAGPWAAAARPGDRLQLAGPGGAYAPDPGADWHLLAGDASVIPAIAASLARVRAEVPAHVVIELDDPADRQAFETAADAHVQWLEADGAGRSLTAALAALEFPAGAVHAFVHGEAESVRAVRRHLVVERGIPRDALSISGYWKRRRTEDGWREDKAEWNRLVASDEAAA